MKSGEQVKVSPAEAIELVRAFVARQNANAPILDI